MMEAIYGIGNLGFTLSDSTQCCWHEIDYNTKKQSNKANPDAITLPSSQLLASSPEIILVCE